MLALMGGYAIAMSGAPQTQLLQERIVLKRSSLCFAFAAALLANAAFAQALPPAPGGQRSPQPPGAAPTPPASKGAHLRIEQGDNVVDLKCADDEPTQACADIATHFLDRLGMTQPRTTGSALGSR
jgi:hypothetical protein